MEGKQFMDTKKPKIYNYLKAFLSSAKGAAMIKFIKVVKKYGGRIALDEMNLEIKKGEFVFVVGASGAGKSTFSKLLIREIIPERGQILFRGQNIVRMKDKDIPHYRRNIGFVFQDFRLLPERTVFENVAFPLEIAGYGERAIREMVTKMLEKVGLLPNMNLMPAELSGGEQQRVAMARAVINKPSLLIADEPTGNLDPKNSMEIIRLIDDINKMGTTVIIATHDREIVDQMRKRVLVLERGKLVDDMAKGRYYQ